MSTLKDLITRALRAQQEYLDKYRAEHTTLGCRITHMIGVPMIMASILVFALYLALPLKITAFITQVAFSQPNLQQFMFCFRVAIPNILQDILTIPSAITNLIAGVSLFSIGWVLQFIGHMFFEKNSPLFLSHPFNPLSYTTAVLFIAQEFGRLIARPFKCSKK